MNIMSTKPAALSLFAMLAVPFTGSLHAQELDRVSLEEPITVLGSVPTDLSELIEGPEIEGIISARNGNKIQVTSDDGISTEIDLSASTEIKGSGGFLGLDRNEIAANALLNGLPVTVETLQWGNGLVASKIKYKNGDLDTAAMIHGGTSQRFAQQGAAIEDNTAATEALRGRMGDIDQYNIKGTTNVYFSSGRWNLTPAAENDLCAMAAQANSTDNALLLVVGYTDSDGSQDFNQTLSERRAGRVVNHLQQQCDWAPYRMLTPTGMAEADPTASNDTSAGKAQNRRVSVNILVSKALDGI